MPAPEDLAVQHRNARETAVVFDLTGWTILSLGGRDAVTFLNNFCTNDLKTLPPGEGLEAFVTNVKARVVAHVLIFREPEKESASDALTLITAPGQGERLASHLDRYVIREDVTIQDRTAESGLLGMTAPQDSPVPLPGAPPDAPEVGRFACRFQSFGDVNCQVMRVDLFGRPGCLIEGPREGIAQVLRQQETAGITCLDAAVFDALRIEALYPLSGTDVGEEQLAPEADRPWAISYTKGCYLGQEPIARIDALGHVNRLLRGLRLESGAVPEPGTALLAEGKEIGSITSATMSFADGQPVALGYVRAKFAEPGTTLSVRTPGGEVPAVVFGQAT